MRDFVYNGQPSRVVFGAGSLAHLEREVQLLGQIVNHYQAPDDPSRKNVEAVMKQIEFRNTHRPYFNSSKRIASLFIMAFHGYHKCFFT